MYGSSKSVILVRSKGGGDSSMTEAFDRETLVLNCDLPSSMSRLSSSLGLGIARRATHLSMLVQQASRGRPI